MVTLKKRWKNIREDPHLWKMTKSVFSLVGYLIAFILLSLVLAGTVFGLDNAIVYLPMDNSTVNGAFQTDVSAGGHNAEVRDDFVQVSGVINEGIQNDGTNDELWINKTTDLMFRTDDDFTISFWWKNPIATESGDYIFGVEKNAGVASTSYLAFYEEFVYPECNGFPVWLGEGNTNGNMLRMCQTAVNVSDNSWHHQAIVFNGSNGNCRWYVDGSEVTITFRTGTCDMIDEGWMSGGDSGQWGLGSLPSRASFGASSFDEFAIYGYDFTPQNVTDVYNAGFGYNPYTPPPGESAPGGRLNVTFNNWYALDSDDNKIYSLDTTNVSNIEKLRLNFSVQANNSYNGGYLNFTANGTAGCSKGNLQSYDCYNTSSVNINDWYIKFVNDTQTITYDGANGNRGDSIIQDNTADLGYYNIVFTIDEHYNPNVWKWYNALYNWSDIKWQNGVNQRITQNNVIRILVNDTDIPYNADVYKLDFRVNHSVVPPTQPLNVYLCNSSYVTGARILSNGCILVADKLHDDFQDDGTKFRQLFTNGLITSYVDNINEITQIILDTAELSPNKYYELKTVKATATGWTQKWYYSTDDGASFNAPVDGYETELNINWFFDGLNPTGLVFDFCLNDTYNRQNCTGINYLEWSIDPNINYPPLVNIFYPSNGASLTTNDTINYSISDSNADTLTGSLRAYNIDNSINFSMNITSNESGSTLITAFTEGWFNVTLEVCENATTELFCDNSTRFFRFYTPSAPTTPTTSGTIVSSDDWAFFLLVITFVALMVFCFMVDRGSIIHIFTAIFGAYLTFFVDQHNILDGFLRFSFAMMGIIMIFVGMNKGKK